MAEQEDKPKEVTLIDPKRSYTVAIKLGTLKVSFLDLKNAIITMDESALTPAQISLLCGIAPTEDEIETVVSYTGDKDQLGKVEKFFYEMRQIPYPKLRLEAWLFKLKFPEEIVGLRPDIDALLSAMDEMKNSKKFMKFLTIILAISNFLNAKGPNKNSYGFKLKSLHYLEDTKTGDGKSNLLRYLVEHVAAKHNDILHFYQELSHVPLAKRVAISQLKESIGMISKGIKQIEEVTNKYKSVSLHENDAFNSVMGKFHDEACAVLNDVNEKMKEIEKRLGETAELYGEDKTTFVQKPEDFFSEFDSFLSKWKFEIQQMEQRKLNQEKQNRLAEKRKTGKTPTTPRSNYSSQVLFYFT